MVHVSHYQVHGYVLSFVKYGEINLARGEINWAFIAISSFLSC